MDNAENPTTLTLEAYISTKKGENRKRASHCFLKWHQLSIQVKKKWRVNFWPGRPNRHSYKKSFLKRHKIKKYYVEEKLEMID